VVYLSTRDGCDGRFLSIEFFSSWFPELLRCISEGFGAVKSRYNTCKDLRSIKFLCKIAFLPKTPLLTYVRNQEKQTVEE
jgi:hypothetical protein